MSKFFIYRPIFAWVIAIFVMIAGVVSITQLPVAQFPSVAPPTIQVSAVYPGASAQTLNDSVFSLIEREMNGAEGLMYMESKTQSNGTGSLSLVFEANTDSNIAQIEVQNRLARVEPKLPAEVKQLGLRVDRAMSNFLMVMAFTSDNPALDKYDIGDYVSRNVLPEIQRIDGVGNAQFFGAERAMRVWLNPAKMRALNLSTTEVNNAIRNQNIQIPGGALGDTPSITGQSTTAAIVIPGQMSSAEEFGEIILRANADGSMIRLRDVAKIELGAQGYAFDSRTNGKSSVAIGIQLSATANAMATAKSVRDKMQELEKFFPHGVQWSIPFDTSEFVSISIEKVIHTLLEAIVLVFLVMLLFLQNIRYTIIPTIVVPVALLGTFSVLYFLGMSINMLAMFGMVLVIGIVVDDAIVVVENVERIMTEEHLSPKEATVKAMHQISGAVVGITVILVSVFIPLAMFSGSVGNIYRQFATVMVVSIAFSGFFALTLSPALCGSILKPHQHNEQKKGMLGRFFTRFNHHFHQSTNAYESRISKLIKHTWRLVLVYVAIILGIGFLFMRLPTGFLPMEDQGIVLANIQLPPGATQERALAVVKKVEQQVLAQPEVKAMTGVLGFSFAGQGQNTALAFITLKDWSERTDKTSSATQFAHRMTGMLNQIQEAFIFVLSPPAIPELGNSDGFNLRLQDRGGKGHEALLAARNQLLGMAAQSPVLMGVRPDGLEDAPQLEITIDRQAAAAQGVNMSAVAQALATYVGSSYINDFPNQGRLQRVVVQANAEQRMDTKDIMQLTVPNISGQTVPLSAFSQSRWITGPVQVIRYNGYPAYSINGQARPGYSSGDAMAEMENLMAKLPPGFGYEWTGQSLDEKKAGAQSIILYAFSILAVFLCLAALYESWSIPFAVILVVPLGVLGVLLGVFLRNMPNDIYFQIGLVTVIGLSAKNAILIVEFAKDLQTEGMGLLKATVHAARLRFRPIIMTSLAFILGVTPLFFASGASSASQREIGTGVLFGMSIGTLLAIFMVPSFYVFVRRWFSHETTNQKHTPTTPQKDKL